MILELFNQVSVPRTQLNHILKSIQIDCDHFSHYQSNDRITDFLIDNTRLLRLSRQKMPEVENQNRAQNIAGIPKIYNAGTFELENQTLYYALTDFIPGETLYDAINNLDADQAKNIGKEIAHFIRKLHKIENNTYDIGHYVPVIPTHRSTWRNGHELYVQFMKCRINTIALATEDLLVLERAFLEIDRLMSALDYSSGPRFLHNDLHPKNIIIHEGNLSGVIDWECAQYGESDFELTHFMHWMHFSMNESLNFKVLVDSLLETYQMLFNVPDLLSRLLVYQLEHEIIQIVWNPSNPVERLDKIRALIR